MKPRKNPACIAMMVFGLMLGLSSCTAEAKEGNKDGNKAPMEKPEGDVKSDGNMKKPDGDMKKPASNPDEKK